MIDPVQEEEVFRYLGKPDLYSRAFLRIDNKMGSNVSLVWNNTQRHAYAVIQWCRHHNIPLFFLILKSRQPGISTWAVSMCFHRVTTGRGQKAITIAHNEDTTKLLFKKANQFYDCLPSYMRPLRRTQSIRELDYVDFGSLYSIGTAGGRSNFGVGRTQNIVHASEVGNWLFGGHELFSALKECVPVNKGMFLGESTAYSPSGVFYEKWMESRRNLDILKEWVRGGKIGQADTSGVFVPIFLPWFYNTEEYVLPVSKGQVMEYSDEEEFLVRNYHLKPEQINWRRWTMKKCGSDFQKWYPEDDMSCFFFTDARGFPELDESKHFQPINISSSSRQEYWDLGGIDFGADHPFSYLKCLIHKKTFHAHFYQERTGRDVLLEDIAKKIKADWTIGRKPARIYADPSSRQGRIELKARGVITHNAANARAESIDLMRYLLRTDQMTIDPRECPVLCKQLLQSHRVRLGSGFGDIEKENDDSIDAARYILYSFFVYCRKKKVVTPWMLNTEVIDNAVKI